MAKNEFSVGRYGRPYPVDDPWQIPAVLTAGILIAAVWYGATKPTEEHIVVPFPDGTRVVTEPIKDTWVNRIDGVIGYPIAGLAGLWTAWTYWHQRLKEKYARWLRIQPDGVALSDAEETVFYRDQEIKRLEMSRSRGNQFRRSQGGCQNCVVRMTLGRNGKEEKLKFEYSHWTAEPDPLAPLLARLPPGVASGATLPV